jgi:hypothetical protein
MGRMHLYLYIVFVSFLIVFIIGIVYGFIINKYWLLPYQIVDKVSDLVMNMGDFEETWSIGIYEGSDPFKMSPVTDIKNPVLTAKDVTDVDAIFVADPFIIADNNKYYMFFEVLNKKTL